MNRISLLYILVLFFFFEACYKEKISFDTLPNDQLELALILKLNYKNCFFDKSSNTLRYPIDKDSIQNFTPHVQFQDYADISINNIRLTNKTTNNLGNVKINEEYLVEITVKDVLSRFTLTFTNLPMIRIVTPNQIIDEPQKIARFTINYPSQQSNSLSSFIGVDFRGGSTQFNPKKSYGFSFLNTMSLDHKSSRSLFYWQKNEDWILDAMYSDKSKLRNKLSFEVWKAMNPLEHESINAQLVELYINNDHQGIYCLTEQMNAEKLGLKDLEAVLYKATAWGDGATAFEFLSSAMPLFIDTWDGWEQKHPRPKDKINWKPLYDLRDLVVNQNNAVFSMKIDTQVDLEILIDYYILLNLVSAFDNSGKNIIWGRKNAQSPFFITPWDLDGTWGRSWDGLDVNSTTVLSNQLFQRLLNLDVNFFKQNLKNRWFSLRTNILTNASLATYYEKSFIEIEKSNILAIEALKWGINIDIQQEQAYLTNWINNRLIFLDDYFTSI